MPLPLLEGHQEYVEDGSGVRALKNEIRDLKNKLAHAELEAQHAKADITQTLGELRRLTMPFYRLLQAVHGEIDALGVSGDSAAVTASPSGTDSRWQSFKDTFPGIPARIIDALLSHREMSITQLGVLLHTHYNTVQKALQILTKAGALSKDGGRNGKFRLNT
jgi:hypothetical protein